MADSTIYALTEQGVVKYIGQSKNPAKRYRQHCRLSDNKSHTKRCNWLRKCIKTKQLPELVILKITDTPDKDEIELIKEYRDNGFNLVNTADGGKDTKHLARAKQNMPWGKHHSPVQKTLMALQQNIKTQKRYGGDVEHAEKLLQKTLDLVNSFGLKEMNLKLWEKYHGNF